MDSRRTRSHGSHRTTWWDLRSRRAARRFRGSATASTCTPFTWTFPAGATALDVAFDFISPPESGGFTSGSSTTTELAVLNWNQLLLYPQGSQPDELQYQATLTVPNSWRYGTALPIQRESGNQIEFQPASLTTLVDSPVSAGAHYRTIELGSEPRNSALPPRGRRQRSRPRGQPRTDQAIQESGERSRRAVRLAPLPQLSLPVHAQRSRGALRTGAPRIERRPHRRAHADRLRTAARPAATCCRTSSSIPGTASTGAPPA